MFRRALLFLDFRSGRLFEEFRASQAATKLANKYDHIGIDVTGLVANTQFIVEKHEYVARDRDTEMLRLAKTAITTVRQRLKPTKSICFFFDGSDPLWKVREKRAYPDKKFARRFLRSACSPVMHTLEEQIVPIIMEKKALSVPPEIIVSGVNTPGPSKGKISAWMRDLAAREDIPSTDTICIVGGADLVLSVVGAIPLTNVTMATSGDLRAMDLRDLLNWFGVGSRSSESGEGVNLAMVRADVLLLYLMTDGCTATDLNAIRDLAFVDVMAAYQTIFFEPGKNLFSEKGNKLLLDVAALEQLIATASGKAHGPRATDTTGDFLEVLLQSHSMFCGGGIRNYKFLPAVKPSIKPPAVRCEQLVGHLKAIAAKTPKISALEDESGFALTAAENLMLIQSVPSHVEQIMPFFVGGHELPEGVANEIIETKDFDKALSAVHNLLSKVDPTTHGALQHMPAHRWTQTPGEQGPPLGFKYSSILLGELSAMVKAEQQQ